MIKKYDRVISQEEIEKTIKEYNDKVNHPIHYKGVIECIDAMQEVLGKKGTISFCIGNAFKYIWRCRKKHETPIEGLREYKLVSKSKPIKVFFRPRGLIYETYVGALDVAKAEADKEDARNKMYRINKRTYRPWKQKLQIIV